MASVAPIPYGDELRRLWIHITGEDGNDMVLTDYTGTLMLGEVGALEGLWTAPIALTLQSPGYAWCRFAYGSADQQVPAAGKYDATVVLTHTDTGKQYCSSILSVEFTRTLEARA